METQINRKQNSFTKSQLPYIIVAVLGLGTIVVNRIINGFDNILWIADFGSIFGIIYAIFNAKHRFIALPLNLVSTAFIIATDIIQEIWLNTAICVLITVPFVIYGMIRWKRNEKSDPSKNFNKLSRKSFVYCFISYLVLCIAFAFILRALNSNLYYLDTLYSAGCVFGLILLSRQYIDQFFFFNVGNVAGIAMYLILTLQNINNLPLLVLSIVFFTLNTIGYFNWKRLMKEQKLM